ncbi:MAG: nucleotidyltransferase domain-containing protein [Candidatus Aenigmatarchaeota archaeon]
MFTEMNEKQFQLMEPFFQDPDLEVSIRELSRKSGLSPGFVSRTVPEAVENGYLEVEEIASAKIVSTGDNFQDLKRIYNLDSLYSLEIIEKLEKALYPEAIVLFGSYEKGEDIKNSDIDIAVINGRDVDMDLEEYEEILGRSINLHFIKDPGEADENFMNSLANGTLLSGHLDLR